MIEKFLIIIISLDKPSSIKSNQEEKLMNKINKSKLINQKRSSLKLNIFFNF